MHTTLTERAVFARLARRLSQDGMRLHRCRESVRARWFPSLMRYYATDANRVVVCADDSLENWARELGALRPDERLA